MTMGHSWGIYDYGTIGHPAFLCHFQALENKWVAIKVYQHRVGTKYEYAVEWNGTLVYIENNKVPANFEHVKLYASDPWYTAYNSKIRNLCVEIAEEN